MRIKIAFLATLIVVPATAQQSCPSIHERLLCNKTAGCTWNALGAGPASPGKCIVAFSSFIVSTKDGYALQITLSDPAKLAKILQQLSSSNTITPPQANSQITVQMKGFSQSDMRTIRNAINNYTKQDDNPQ